MLKLHTLSGDAPTVPALASELTVAAGLEVAI